MSTYVANASPLIAFRQLGRLDLLHTLVGSVVVPPAVVAEVFHMELITVRLPDTLYRQLQHLAEIEGASLDQYVVDALTRQAAVAHDLVPTTPAERQHQHERFLALLERLGPPATQEQVRITLMHRDRVAPEPDLSPAARSLIDSFEQ